MCSSEPLTLEDRLEIAEYLAFRKVRAIKETVTNREGRKLLTRILKWLGPRSGRLRAEAEARHKRPIEPDITGGGKTAGNGTAKPLTQSNGKMRPKR